MLMPLICACAIRTLASSGGPHMWLSHILASVALASVSMGANAAEPEATVADPQDIRADADAILEAGYPADGPGVAAIVMRGGRVIYTGARGLADLESGRPIAPDTVFKIASITKQFTAAVVLQLVAEGKLSLDEPVSRFFPDWPQPGARATISQLLNHTSGIQDISSIPGFMDTERSARSYTTAELLGLIRSYPSTFEPGQRAEYNSSGYILLGAIIEQVTGKAWHEAIVERIARPLGLETVGYAVTAESDPALAVGYTRAQGQFSPARSLHSSVGHAAGGLAASASDLAKWNEALHSGRVISPELYAEMTRPAVIADGSSQPFGFGLRLVDVLGLPAMLHGGAGRGIDTTTVYVPSQDLFVAVLSNTDVLPVHTNSVTRRLLALALGKPVPLLRRQEVPRSDLEPLFGAYRTAEGSDFLFFARDGKLYLSEDDEEHEAMAAGDDRFGFGPNELRWLAFIRQPDGTHLLELHNPDADSAKRAVRIGPVPPPFTADPAVLQTYVGSYATEGPVLTVALADEGGLTIAVPGQPPFPMRPVSDTEFRVNIGGIRVVFYPGDGVANRLTMFLGGREFHGTRR